MTPSIWREAVDIRANSEDVFQTAYAIMAHIYTNFTYNTGTTNVTTTANVAIKKRSGVCQDFAHVMVALCRSLQIPARYVSGYFYDRTRDPEPAWSRSLPCLGRGVCRRCWLGWTGSHQQQSRRRNLHTGRSRPRLPDVAPVIGTYYGDSGSSLNIQVQLDWLQDKD